MKYINNLEINSIYDFDNAFSINELLCKFWEKIEETINISNESIDLLNWIKEEGVPTEVEKIITELVEDGTIEQMINVNKIEELRTLITNKITDVNEQIEEIQANVMEQLETKANKNEIFTMANMGQDIKEAMTGGSVAVVGKNAILSENIVNEQVTNVKTNFIESGKNKINKLMCEDGYIYYDSKKRVNAQYCVTEKIKVLPNTKYSVRSKAPSSAYGDFITFWNNNDYLAVTYTNFITNGVTYGNSFTTPENCNCVIVSFLKTEKNTMQLEIGDYTTYEDYICYVNKYPINPIVNPIAVRDKTFKTIQEAVDYAVNKDTIYIKSGTYKENVDCKSKYLNFIGEGAASTILCSESNNYYNAPLHIAKGYVKGIQIIAQKPTDWTLPGGDNKTPYAVHIDWDESVNSTLTFEDCIFKSEWNAGAGIGLRKGFTLTFKNCEIISTGGINTGCVGGLFFHDNYVDGYEGTQAIILDNCNIKSVNTEKWLRVDSSGRTGNDVRVTFRRCIGYSPIQTGSGINNIITTNGDGWLYSNNMTLTKDSFGNNNDKLNHL